jgi:BolA protein
MSGFDDYYVSRFERDDNSPFRQFIYASGDEMAIRVALPDVRLARCLGETGQSTDSYGMTHPSTITRTDRLHATLTQAFAPAVLRIEDDSAHHAGHSGAQPGGQTHYSVLMVSAAFQGVGRVARSRAVHAALAAEFGPPEQGGMHALALTLRTPEEHAAQA